MSFDKIKTMRNAERFLANGKIKAAIDEYKIILENEPRDFSTLNILGDLYAKASENKEAVDCFMQVAEHYNKQGFSHKAIAIYNKISKLNPDSTEISSKLAQLYQAKGSLAEAREQYELLAAQYQKEGKKNEALQVWKQLANLDPQGSDIFLKIAEACWQSDQKDEALAAYYEAAQRFSSKMDYASATTAYTRVLEISPDNLPAIKGLVDAQVKSNCADEATRTLEVIVEKQPNNREIVSMLIDCYLNAGNLVKAEEATIKLVEKEPASYPKFVDVIEAHLANTDVDGAARVLAIASEHMLVGRRADELRKYIDEILTRNPEHLDTLNLLVRYHNWHQDEPEIKATLERVADAARNNQSHTEERNALVQLVMMVPHDVNYARRLQEANIACGAYDAVTLGSVGTVADEPESAEVPTFESYATLVSEESTNGNGDVEKFDAYSSNFEDDYKVSTQDGEFVTSNELDQPVHAATDGQTENDLTVQQDDAEQAEANAAAMAEFTDPAVSEAVQTSDDVAEIETSASDVEQAIDSNDVPTFEEAVAATSDSDGVEDTPETDVTSDESKLDDAQEVAVDAAPTGEASEIQGDQPEQSDVPNVSADQEFGSPTTDFALEREQEKLKQELESIEFYIDQGYVSLAEKSLRYLTERFGDKSEIKQYWEKLNLLVGASSNSGVQSESASGDPVQNPEGAELITEKVAESDMPAAMDSEVTEVAENDDPVAELSQNFDSDAQINEQISPVDKEIPITPESDRVSDQTDVNAQAAIADSNSDTEVAALAEPSEQAAQAAEIENELPVEANPGLKESALAESFADDEVEVEVINQTASEPVEENEQNDQIAQSINEDEPMETASVKAAAVVEETSAESVQEEAASTSIDEDAAPSLDAQPAEMDEEPTTEQFDDDSENNEDSDFEGDYQTYFQTGTAYKEMGLIEDALREFQDAYKFLDKDDKDKKFFECCNMIGICFVERKLPKIALMWFTRALECAALGEDEKHGLYYEMANSYELCGDKEKAAEYFSEIYAMDVDYRDVGERLQTLQ